jgi:hypothetical protein
MEEVPAMIGPKLNTRILLAQAGAIMGSRFRAEEIGGFYRKRILLKKQLENWTFVSKNCKNGLLPPLYGGRFQKKF